MRSKSMMSRDVYFAEETTGTEVDTGHAIFTNGVEEVRAVDNTGLKYLSDAMVTMDVKTAGRG